MTAASKPPPKAEVIVPDASFTVRRLHPGDEETLIHSVAIGARFEHDPDAVEPDDPLDSAAATAFLADPAVLFWVAEAGDDLVGSLHCYTLGLLAAGHPTELLLYEIGTEIGWRRRGVGLALIRAMEAHMAAEGIEEVWLGAAATAVEFYRSCGFESSDETFMDKSIIP